MITPKMARDNFNINKIRDITNTVKLLEDNIDEVLTTEVEFLEKGSSQTFKMKEFAQCRLSPCRHNTYINNSSHINETIAKHYRENWWDAKISKNSANQKVLTISILKKEDE